MFLDAQLTYSDAQALTASAVSTNVVDHGTDRNLGIGEPLTVIISIDAALAGTSPTIAVALQTSPVVGFGAPVTVATTQTYTALATGAIIALAVPADTSIDRFTRLSYTLGGTTPTATVTASLQPAKMVQANTVYAGGFLVD